VRIEITNWRVPSPERLDELNSEARPLGQAKSAKSFPRSLEVITVLLGFNYERLLSHQTVFLVFGALRFWEEVQLLRTAVGKAKVPKRLLLLAARYDEGVRFGVSTGDDQKRTEQTQGRLYWDRQCRHQKNWTVCEKHTSFAARVDLGPFIR
jgi:hypothetical protein